jgi:hypothetical protein
MKKAGITVEGIRVRVLLHTINQGRELGYIQHKITVLVKLQCLDGDMEIWWVNISVTDNTAQDQECLAETLARSAFGVLRPQQSRQEFAAMWTIGFNHQVSQQRANFIIFKSCDGAFS